MTKITRTLYEDLFMKKSSSVILRIKNVSDKTCTENPNTHFMSKYSFPPKIRPFMRWGKKSSKTTQATVDNRMQRMRFACWNTRGRDAHSEYVILMAFRRQKW